MFQMHFALDITWQVKSTWWHLGKPGEGEKLCARIVARCISVKFNFPIKRRSFLLRLSVVVVCCCGKFVFFWASN